MDCYVGDTLVSGLREYQSRLECSLGILVEESGGRYFGVLIFYVAALFSSGSVSQG